MSNFLFLKESIDLEIRGINNIINGELSNGEDIMKFNKTLRLLANGHADKYDSNLNGMSAREINQRFEQESIIELQKDTFDYCGEWFDVYDENGTYLRHLINGRVINNGKDQYGNYLKDNLSYKIRPYYEYSTRNYFDQKEIHWWIQTKGAMPDYSPSSLVRVVKLYQQPSADVSVSSGSYGYPITINMTLDSAHQSALVYYLEIASNSSSNSSMSR